MAEVKMYDIDANTRVINIPSSTIIGVESDEKVERIRFRCDRYPRADVDLLEFNKYVNYRNANGDLNAYLIEDVEVDEDNIILSWILHRDVTKYKGKVNFIVCAKKSTAEGEIDFEWNTRVATATVDEGLEVAETIEEEYADVIEQILVRLNAIETGGDVDLSNYYTKNESDERYALKGESVDLSNYYTKTEVDKLIDNIDIGGSGLSSAQIDGLEEFFDTLVGTEESNSAKIKAMKLLRGISLTDYAISFVGANASIDNDVVSVTENEPYSANVYANEGYTLESITVTMNDIDITSQCVEENSINIAHVTGNVVITVTTQQAVSPSALLFERDEIVSTVDDGSEGVDSGVKLLDHDYLTIMFTIDSQTKWNWRSKEIMADSSTIKSLQVSSSGNGSVGLLGYTTQAYGLSSNGILDTLNSVRSDINNKIVIVAHPYFLSDQTYKVVLTVYGYLNDVVKKVELADNNSGGANIDISVERTNITFLGHIGYNTYDSFQGKLSNVRIYGEALSDTEIENYLKGVE